MKTTVIHHSADFDGIFCREIARKFLPEAELIGWDFGDEPLPIPIGKVYVLDLPCDRPFGFQFQKPSAQTFTETSPGDHHKDFYDWVWIDHHKSSIETHPLDLPGYRIDGVAACRLAWQWFKYQSECEDKRRYALPLKSDFVGRHTAEPLAVLLAGEYDVWDKRDPNAELFQHGLRSRDLSQLWPFLLSSGTAAVEQLLEAGEAIRYAKTHENESIIKALGFTIHFEGLTFLACNHARFNSLLFTAGLKPKHDACLGFVWDGGNSRWNVSLYHAPGKEHHDLSTIAVKFGGGGHKGACGFQCEKLPFIP